MMRSRIGLVIFLVLSLCVMNVFAARAETFSSGGDNVSMPVSNPGDSFEADDSNSSEARGWDAPELYKDYQEVLETAKELKDMFDGYYDGGWTLKELAGDTGISTKILGYFLNIQDNEWGGAGLLDIKNDGAKVEVKADFYFESQEAQEQFKEEFCKEGEYIESGNVIEMFTDVDTLTQIAKEHLDPESESYLKEVTVEIPLRLVNTSVSLESEMEEEITVEDVRELLGVLKEQRSEEMDSLSDTRETAKKLLDKMADKDNVSSGNDIVWAGFKVGGTDGEMKEKYLDFISEVGLDPELFVDLELEEIKGFVSSLIDYKIGEEGKEQE